MSVKPKTNQERVIRFGIDEELQNLEYNFNERNCVLPFLIDAGYTPALCSKFKTIEEFIKCPSYTFMQRKGVSRMQGDDIKVELSDIYGWNPTFYEVNKNGFGVSFLNIHSPDFKYGRISPFDCLVAFMFGGDKKEALEYLKTL